MKSEIDSRSFTHGPHTLAYEIHGSGERVVVLLHGILLDSGVNRHLARSLASAGFRVVLLDLLGHGRSDRPRHATEHRMDLYAGQVVGLLDELGIDQAVVGGLSLGADVSLQVAVAAPERVAGLLLEMPVLEMAVPVAALLFVPALLGAHYLSRLIQRPLSAVSRMPKTGIDPVDDLVGFLSISPREAAAVLHGVLLGPIAPTLEQRRAIQVPALVIGHRADLLHPFSDADSLARQLPNARLVTARSIAELRIAPRRLTAEIVRFLNQVWAPSTSAAA